MFLVTLLRHMRDDWAYDSYGYANDWAIDPLLLLACVVGVVFFLGVQSGRSTEHGRQRRLGKIRGRINSIDPAEVTDYRLSTIEDVLPKEKKR